MRNFRLTTLLLLLIATLGGTVLAQDGEGEIGRVEIVEVVAEDLPQITLLVNVFDPFEVPVPGLTAENFTVTVDGQAATITEIENITRDELPISVVLVIDTSESMLGLPMLAAQDAAHAFLDRLRPGDQVALVEFDSTVRPLQDFTSDFDAVRAAIDTLQADGRTALYQAAYEAAQLASQAQTPRRYVVLLTDGNEYGNLSTAGPQDAIELAAANNIPFYTFGLGFGVERAFLEPLATNTRGEALFRPTPEDLAAEYSYLATYLRTQYIITLTADAEPDGTDHEIEVTVGAGSDRTRFTGPDFYPQIALEGVPGGAIEQPITLTAEITAPRGLGAIAADIGGEPITLNAGPAVENTVAVDIPIDPYTLTPGERTLTVRAEDALGGARTAQATLRIGAVIPELTITGLDEGALLTEPQVTVGVTAERTQQPIERLAFAVDGQTVEEFTAPPYEATIDLLPFGPGAHTLGIEVESGGEMFVFERGFTLDPQLFVTPSPTPTATFTPSSTPTNTPSATPTATNTPAPTATPTPLPTDTPDATGTSAAQAVIMTTTAESFTDTPQPPSSTPRATTTPRPTSTPAPTDTAEPTASAEPTDTPEPTSTTTPEPSDTPAPTDTPEPSDTPAPTDTPQPTDTPEPTDTPAPTETPEPTSTATPEPTDTPVPTDTPEPTSTETPSPVPSDTPDATATALQVAQVMTATAESFTATPTDTPEPTVTPTVTDTEEPTETAAPSETPTEAATDTPEPTATRTPAPTATPGPTSTPRPTATATPVPEIVEVGADDGGLGTTQIALLCVAALIVLGLLALFLSRVVGRGARS